MSVQIQCGSCGNKYNVDEEHLGKTTKCADCGENILIQTNTEQIQSVDYQEIITTSQQNNSQYSNNSNDVINGLKHFGITTVTSFFLGFLLGFVILFIGNGANSIFYIAGFSILATIIAIVLASHTIGKNKIINNTIKVTTISIVALFIVNNAISIFGMYGEYSRYAYGYGGGFPKYLLEFYSSVTGIIIIGVYIVYYIIAYISLDMFSKKLQ